MVSRQPSRSRRSPSGCHSAGTMPHNLHASISLLVNHLHTTRFENYPGNAAICGSYSHFAQVIIKPFASGRSLTPWHIFCTLLRMALHDTLIISGKSLSLSNLDKMLYPAAGFTKAAVIDYYHRVGPVILPHLKNRASYSSAIPMAWTMSSFTKNGAPRSVLVGLKPPRFGANQTRLPSTIASPTISHH